MTEEESDAAWCGDEPPGYDEVLADNAGPFCGAWAKVDGRWHVCERWPGCMNDEDSFHCSGDVSWRDVPPDATEWPTRPAPEPSPVGTQAIPPMPEPTPEERALVEALLRVAESVGEFMVETRITFGKPK